MGALLILPGGDGGGRTDLEAGGRGGLGPALEKATRPPVSSQIPAPEDAAKHEAPQRLEVSVHRRLAEAVEPGGGEEGEEQPGRPRPTIIIATCDLCERVIHAQTAKLNRCKKMQSEKLLMPPTFP